MPGRTEATARALGSLAEHPVFAMLEAGVRVTAVPGPSAPYDGDGAEPALFGEQAAGDAWYKLFFGDREPVWTSLHDRVWQSEEERHAVIEAARVQLHA